MHSSTFKKGLPVILERWHENVGVFMLAWQHHQGTKPMSSKLMTFIFTVCGFSWVYRKSGNFCGMEDLYSKDAVVFEVTTCIKMCVSQQRCRLIVTNYLECCKLFYLLYLPCWHFTLVPFSCDTLATSLLVSAIAREGSSELKDPLGSRRPFLMEKYMYM